MSQLDIFTWRRQMTIDDDAYLTEADIALDQAVKLSLTSGEEVRIDGESDADFQCLVRAMYSVRTADVVVLPGSAHMSGEAYLGRYSVWAFQDCEPTGSEVHDA